MSIKYDNDYLKEIDKIVNVRIRSKKNRSQRRHRSDDCKDYINTKKNTHVSKKTKKENNKRYFNEFLERKCR